MSSTSAYHILAVRHELTRFRNRIFNVALWPDLFDVQCMAFHIWFPIPNVALLPAQVCLMSSVQLCTFELPIPNAALWYD